MVSEFEHKRVCRNCLRFEPIAENIGKCRLEGRQVNAEDSCENFCMEIELLNNSDG